MNVTIDDPDILDSLSGAGVSGWKLELLREFLNNNSSTYVKNIQTSWKIVRMGDVVLPVTVNQLEFDNSYVCSPYNGIVSYPLEEMRLLKNPLLKLGLRSLIYSLIPALHIGKINKVVCVNNALLSTNLYPDWQGESLSDLTSALVKAYPNHAIMFRSLNEATTPELCQTFLNSDYQLVASRQLYVMDFNTPGCLKHQDLKRDFKLLKSTSYQVVNHDELTDADDARIGQLYNWLYLEKYSSHNPQFTTAWFQLFRKTGQLEYIGLRNQQGQLDGIIGLLKMNGVSSTPLVGYDPSVPLEEGLYRLLTALAIKKAQEYGPLFNMSSGAGPFKRTRGGKPFLEYSAVYTRHLSWRQRCVWQAIGFLMNNVGAKIVQRYEF